MTSDAVLPVLDGSAMSAMSATAAMAMSATLVIGGMAAAWKLK